MRDIDKCPRCGSKKNKVIDSRKEFDDTRHRRKVCCECGARWSTREISLEDYYSFTGFNTQKLLNTTEATLKRTIKELQEMQEFVANQRKVVEETYEEIKNG